jgi:hypothetical protein
VTLPPDLTITFGENDYRFGAGPLTLRLEHVDRVRPVHIDGEAWYQVTGVQVGWNGNDLDRREVLIRGTRIPLAH